MAPPTRFERVASPLGGVRSIQLSYGGVVMWGKERASKRIFLVGRHFSIFTGCVGNQSFYIRVMAVNFSLSVHSSIDIA